MGKIYKAGMRLKSAVCDTQIMVLRVPASELDLRCGGAEMLTMDAAAPEGVALDPGFSAGTATGKRYVDEAESMEFLCTKGGQGSLSLGPVALEIKQAKALPSSD
jgi:hypothetical protein